MIKIMKIKNKKIQELLKDKKTTTKPHQQEPSQLPFEISILVLQSQTAINIALSMDTNNLYL